MGPAPGGRSSPHSGFVIAGVITTIVLVGRRNRGWRVFGRPVRRLFAAGEISEDEHRHRLTVLKEQQP